MNSPASSRVFVLWGLIAPIAIAAGLSASRGADAPKKINPAGKVYVADLTGESQIAIGQRIEDLVKKSVYSVSGSIIETKPGSSDMLVFSNGTGAFVDANTRIEIRRFTQEPFAPTRTDMDVEPSISHTEAFLVRGFVGLCTSKLVAGSNLSFLTPLASVNIRGRRVIIETNDEISTISVLEGSSTVNGGPLDLSGRVVATGEQAVVRRGSVGQPNSVTIEKISPERLSILDEKGTMACMSKRTVYFETREPGARGLANNFGNAFGGDDPSAEEIVAVPVVPTNLSPNVTISPSTLPAGR